MSSREPSWLVAWPCLIRFGAALQAATPRLPELLRTVAALERRIAALEAKQTRAMNETGMDDSTPAPIPHHRSDHGLPDHPGLSPTP